MKLKTLSRTMLIFIALLSCSLVKPVLAGYISLGTYDVTGSPRDVFVIWQDVRIIASSSDMPITITVTDPNGTVLHNETYYGYEYDKILSGLTEKTGWFTVMASSPMDTVHINYACTYFQTVGGRATPINIPMNKPETPTLWIWLLTIILPLIATVIFVKLKKKKQ